MSANTKTLLLWRTRYTQRTKGKLQRTKEEKELAFGTLKNQKAHDCSYDTWLGYLYLQSTTVPTVTGGLGLTKS